ISRPVREKNSPPSNRIIRCRYRFRIAEGSGSLRINRKPSAKHLDARDRLSTFRSRNHGRRRPSRFLPFALLLATDPPIEYLAREPRQKLNPEPCQDSRITK